MSMQPGRLTLARPAQPQLMPLRSSRDCMVQPQIEVSEPADYRDSGVLMHGWLATLPMPAALLLRASEMIAPDRPRCAKVPSNKLLESDDLFGWPVRGEVSKIPLISQDGRVMPLGVRERVFFLLIYLL